MSGARRRRVRASDIAPTPQPPWLTIVLMVLAVALVWFIKAQVLEGDGEIVRALTGTSELELPPSVLGQGPDGAMDAAP